MESQKLDKLRRRDSKSLCSEKEKMNLKKDNSKKMALVLMVIIATFVSGIQYVGAAEKESQNNLYRYMDAKTEKYGLVNRKGEIVVKAVYDQIGKFSDGLASVRKNSKCGFVNQEGKWVVPLKYAHAGDFSDGLAPVSNAKGTFYINTEGKRVFKNTYEYAYEFGNGLAPVKTKNGFGYINTNGKLVISDEYSWVYPFHEERAVVLTSYGKKMVIDTKGNVIAKYTDDLGGLEFSDGYLRIRKNEKYGFINKKGKITIKPSSKWYQVENFSEGLAVYWQGPTTGESAYGYIDKKGKIAIKPIYGQAFPFSEGLACVQDIDSFKFGFINKTGKQVIKCTYDYAFSFENGLACVIRDGKTYFIDRKGNIKITVK